MSKKQIALYTQTHWDREWYWEFEKYRTQLVSVARKVISELEEGKLAVFHLDGQTCALEDILELEPELEPKIKKLVSNKKLRIGPWYVLADQMLVSGESLVRNLERGVRIATKYGEPMKVGYLPDTFGHTQDMPRLLRGFGIDNAVVWRGVPALDDGPEFYWKSPDGSKVMGYLLPDGYYQTAFQEAQYISEGGQNDLLTSYLLSWLGLDSEGKFNQGNGRSGRYRSFSKHNQSSLVPVGGDHLYPPLGLSDLVSDVQKKLDGLASGEKVSVGVVDLETFLEETKQAIDKPLELVRLVEGELRTNDASKDHCRAFMLAGVLSSRLYLKRENRLLENRLFHINEPLVSILSSLGITRYPDKELDNATKLLLLNHPHDSICGCSVDDVHSEMLTRNKSIHQILDLLDRQVREEMLCPSVHEWSGSDHSGPYQKPFGFGRWYMDLNDPDAKFNGLVAFNFSSSEISQAVEFKYSILASDLGLKSKGHKSILPLDEKLLDKVKPLLDRAIDKNLPKQIKEISTQTEVFGAVGGVPVYKDVCVVEGLVQLGSIPGFGSVYNLADSKSNQSVSEDVLTFDCAKGIVSNKYFDVTFGDNGGLKVFVKSSTNPKQYDLRPTFYDVADAGDSYNFDPVFDDSPYESSFKSMKFLETGPLSTSVELVHEIEIPSGIEEVEDCSQLKGLEDVDDLVVFTRTNNKIKHEIKTRVEVKANSPILYFDTEWENKSTDHRLEVRLDTGEKVAKTWSENHFSLVERNISRQEIELPVKRALESPLDRFPCQRFFVANDQVFLNKGLPEYSVNDTSVSITVLRAFSMLSRKRLLTRGGGAGPHMPTPEGNCLGTNRVSYGWASLASIVDERTTKGKLSSSRRIAAYSLAERYMEPLWASPVSSQFVELYSEKLKSGDSAHRFLENSNSAIRVAGFYKTPDSEQVTLRLLNVTTENQSSTLKLGLPGRALYQAKLSGDKKTKLKSVDGAYELEFTVNELKTLKIEL